MTRSTNRSEVTMLFLFPDGTTNEGDQWPTPSERNDRAYDRPVSFVTKDEYEVFKVDRIANQAVKAKRKSK